MCCGCVQLEAPLLQSAVTLRGDDDPNRANVSTMLFTLVAYDVAGARLAISNLTDQLQLCRGNVRAAPSSPLSPPGPLPATRLG